MGGASVAVHISPFLCKTNPNYKDERWRGVSPLFTYLNAGIKKKYTKSSKSMGLLV